MKKCGQCEGTGSVENGAPTQYSDWYEVTCPTCNGSGVEPEPTMTPPNVLSDVLVLLADLDDARILPSRTVSIAVDRVLAWSWNPGRLERCKQKLAAGEKAPPIQVNRYRLNGLTWYVVSDSHHRTVAAREAGRTRIAAVVGSETDCHPDRYRLDVAERLLWQKQYNDWLGHCLKLVANKLNDETIAALLAAGVPCKEKGHKIMTNIMFAIEKICEGLLSHAGDEISPYLEDRVTELQALYTTYNSLAPKPEDWPDRAQYYAIDADGAGYWYESKPTFAPLDGAWGAPQWKYDLQHDIDDLLAVLSPSLFLWKRPEKQP